MGTFKKEANRRTREGDTKDRNIRLKGENFYRDRAKVKKINMFKEGKARYNKYGDVIQAATFQSREIPKARVDPNRKWFNNTRVISQDALNHFREKMGAVKKDSYQFLLRQNKLPMSLLEESKTIPQIDVLEQESYEHTFGPKSQRKKPKTAFSSFEEMANAADDESEKYSERLQEEAEMRGDELTPMAKEAIFSKGQSKRIWNELYKVIDSSDVIIHVLDARDPLGTRCKSVEQYMAKETPHKHLIFIMNKCDLIPSKVSAQWIKQLSQDRPTIAYHASMTNPFGKDALITLLRQFSILHKDKKQISVGFIGYPNTGKSSIINSLRKKRVCTTAPIPGETKVWQYITLMKRIYLIDCPGIVPPNSKDTEADILFKGVVRVEHVSYPEQFIPVLLEKCERKHLERTYEVRGWEDSTQFLELIARKHGRLLKGGEPDESGVAKLILNDFNRGKIPWFVPPPGYTGKKVNVDAPESSDVTEAAEITESAEAPEAASDKPAESGEGEEEEWKGLD